MIDLYADGSCPRNPGAGGWAFAIVGLYDRVYTMAGAVEEATNNRMELMAVLKGLEHCVRECPASTIRITSDSQYVIRGLEDWSHKWRKNKWRRKVDGEWVPIMNKDIWPRIYGIAHTTLNCEFRWQRGHVGHRWNELCDKLAGEAAWSLIEKQ